MLCAALVERIFCRGWGGGIDKLALYYYYYYYVNSHEDGKTRNDPSLRNFARRLIMHARFYVARRARLRYRCKRRRCNDGVPRLVSIAAETLKRQTIPHRRDVTKSEKTDNGKIIVSRSVVGERSARYVNVYIRVCVSQKKKNTMSRAANTISHRANFGVAAELNPVERARLFCYV